MTTALPPLCPADSLRRRPRLSASPSRVTFLLAVIAALVLAAPSSAEAACSSTYPVGSASDEVVSFLAAGTNLPFVGPTTFQAVEEGTLTYDSTTHSLQLCDGTQWTALTTAASGGSSQWVNGASGAIYYSGGNVGIGTTGPSSTLQVGASNIGVWPTSRVATINSNVAAANGAGVHDTLLLSNGGTDPGASVYGPSIAFKAASYGTTHTYSTGRILSYFDTSAGSNPGYAGGVLALQYPTNDNVFATGLALRNGNVGIGTTTPEQMLHVGVLYGTPVIMAKASLGATGGAVLRAEADLGANISLSQWGSTYAGVAFGNSLSGFASLLVANDVDQKGLAIGTQQATPIIFGTGSSERMRILGTGNVGIGTTSPTYLLSLGGDTARTIWMERSTTVAAAGNSLTVQAGGTKSGNTDQSGGDLVLSSGTSTGTGSSSIYFKTAAAGTTSPTDHAPATVMMILGNGNVGIGAMPTSKKLTVSGDVEATAYYNNSDRRLKKSVRSIDGKGIDIVRNLRGVSFVWRATGRHALGFIAQEVEGVLPIAVSTDPKGYKSVDYIMLIAPLVEAVKTIDAEATRSQSVAASISAHVAQLDKQVAKLSAANDKLEHEITELRKIVARLDAGSADRRRPQ